MGLQQNLNDIQTNLLSAKTAIAQSISNKGVECSADEALSTYASKIDSISGGSTGGTGEKFVVPDGLKFGYSSEFDPTLFDVSQVTDMSRMFYSATTLTSLDLSEWNTSKVTNIEGMFIMCSGLTSLNVSNWDISSVTNMQTTFNYCWKLTSLDLSNWNTINVTNMDSTFSSCSGLTSLNVSNWNTINVTNMRGLFNSCSGLTSLNLSDWKLNRVNNIDSMFNNCKSLIDLQLNDLGRNYACTSIDLTSCSALTKDSILFLFNNAFDRSAAGYTKTFTIKLNAATKALLSDDELAIVTNKGFTVA